jgi:trehalose 6-phosphate phosphatase
VGELPKPLLPLIADPGRSALCLDFDGTLSAIVADPGAARPLPGVPELLVRLADRFALVAVISGRPVTFLRRVLDAPSGVRLIGLYGLEELDPDGAVVASPGAGAWQETVSEVAALAAAGAPPGVYVEPKGLTVTLHWRHAPRERAWVEGFAARQVADKGLKVYASGMSNELAPPLDVDKGTVVRSITRGMGAVAVFGDDRGDLAAFAALDEPAARGQSVARVAVVHAESPPEVAAGADVVVEGAPGAVALLELMAQAVG